METTNKKILYILLAAVLSLAAVLAFSPARTYASGDIEYLNDLTEGKNLFNPELLEGYEDDAYVQNGSGMINQVFFETFNLRPGKYTVSFDLDAETPEAPDFPFTEVSLRVLQNGQDNTGENYKIFENNPITPGRYFLVFEAHEHVTTSFVFTFFCQDGVPSLTITLSDIQIEAGETMTEYHAYGYIPSEPEPDLEPEPEPEPSPEPEQDRDILGNLEEWLKSDSGIGLSVGFIVIVIAALLLLRKR